MSGNMIEALPVDGNVLLPDFDPITGLRKQIFAKGFGGLSSLVELWMDNNRLKTLTKEISWCTSMQYVNLRRNCLEEIPLELGDIASLEFLVCSHNQLCIVPEELLDLPKLHTLLLDCNKIRHIPPSIQRATALTELDISHNPISGLPAELALCKDLVRLKTVHSAQRLHSVCPTGQWNKMHSTSERVPVVRKDGLGIDFVESRPASSNYRLSTRSTSRSRPSTQCGILSAVQYDSNGDGLPARVSVMAVGGVLPSKQYTAYSTPPISIRPPQTPFSCSRPASDNRYSGAYHQSDSI